MPTPTEEHLQFISEKISSIKVRCGEVAGTPMSYVAEQAVINYLQSIGATVSLLPSRFKEWYSEVPWEDMEIWSSADKFPSLTINSEQLMKTLAKLEIVEKEIRRHISPDRDIQKGVIASLDTMFDQFSKEWYGRAESLSVLISLTGILVIIRIALLNVDLSLSTPQILVYTSIAIPVVWMALDIAKEYALKWVDFNASADDYSTHTQFYDIACDMRAENIFLIIESLYKRRNRRKWQKRLWYFTAASSIIFTIIIAICQN